jgi:hypothetical protein
MNRIRILDAEVSQCDDIRYSFEQFAETIAAAIAAYL